MFIYILFALNSISCFEITEHIDDDSSGYEPPEDDYYTDYCACQNGSQFNYTTRVYNNLTTTTIALTHEVPRRTTTTKAPVIDLTQDSLLTVKPPTKAPVINLTQTTFKESVTALPPTESSNITEEYDDDDYSDCWCKFQKWSTTELDSIGVNETLLSTIATFFNQTRVQTSTVSATRSASTLSTTTKSTTRQPIISIDDPFFFAGQEGDGKGNTETLFASSNTAVSDLIIVIICLTIYFI
ncbi:hypothetical protein LCDV1gp040 [Lymphocystis disease virus 1]|uniref:hypothetical protein n=1 Tax=Fish lymphocystis disease virus TaxID=36363 RepID=UPI0000161ECB|nr:hypothetical protein LCDV1gp040 [Lymphocystis disease virus 1]